MTVSRFSIPPTVPEDSGVNNPYAENAWQIADQTTINNHVLADHLCPSGMMEGIPRYDLEVISYREDIEVGEILEAAYERLSLGDEDINSWILHENVVGKIDVQSFREGIVRTLLYIERLELAKIDWNRVRSIFSGYQDIELDIEAHGDEPFPQFVGWDFIEGRG